MNPHQHQLEKGVPLLFGQSCIDGISSFKQLLIFMNTHSSLVPIGGLGEGIVIHVFYFPDICKLGKIVEQLRYLRTDAAGNIPGT